MKICSNCQATIRGDCWLTWQDHTVCYECWEAYRSAAYNERERYAGSLREKSRQAAARVAGRLARIGR